MRFVPPGFETSTPAPMGFRKKSPADKRRDTQRLLSWQNKKKDTGIYESKYEHSTAVKDYQVKEPFIDQCHSPLSQAIGDSGQGHIVTCESDPLGENQNNEHSSVDSGSEMSIGHEIDSIPHLDKTSTHPQTNENNDHVNPVDDIPKATGINCL